MSYAYQAVTDQIVDALQKGDIPWKKPWTTTGHMNGKSKKAYRGINAFILPLAGYSDPRWFTYKQATELGGQVRKGEKGRTVVFWKMVKADDKVTGKPKTFPFLKSYTVFNFEQIDGLAMDAMPDPILVPAEDIINGYVGKPATLHGQSFAAYYPKLDTVKMPNKQDFDSLESYYLTLFHEYAHSTGHESRLKRATLMNASDGGATYSEEELVAELTAAFLAQAAGIDTTLSVEQSATYIKGWLKAFQGDPKMVVNAATKAQKAADYIRGIKYAEAEATA